MVGKHFRLSFENLKGLQCRNMDEEINRPSFTNNILAIMNLKLFTPNPTCHTQLNLLWKNRNITYIMKTCLALRSIFWILFGIKSKLLGIREDKLHEKDQEKKKTENRNRPRKDHYI